MKNPQFSKTGLVTVERSVKQLLNPDPDIWGPMTLDEAIKAGHVATHQNTVSVQIKAVDGEYAGANIYRDADGVYRVQK